MQLPPPPSEYYDLRDAEIIRLKEQEGKSAVEIAEQFGLSRARVYQIFEKQQTQIQEKV